LSFFVCAVLCCVSSAVIGFNNNTASGFSFTNGFNFFLAQYEVTESVSITAIGGVLSSISYDEHGVPAYFGIYKDVAGVLTLVAQTGNTTVMAYTHAEALSVPPLSPVVLAPGNYYVSVSDLSGTVQFQGNRERILLGITFAGGPGYYTVNTDDSHGPPVLDGTLVSALTWTNDSQPYLFLETENAPSTSSSTSSPATSAAAHPPKLSTSGKTTTSITITGQPTSSPTVKAVKILYRKAGSDGHYTQVYSTLQSNTFMISGLMPCQWYSIYYKVKGPSGWGLDSPKLSVKTMC